MNSYELPDGWPDWKFVRHFTDYHARRPLLTAAILLALLLFVVLGQLDNLLEGMHQPGTTGKTVSSLTGSFPGVASSDDFETTLNTWDAWECADLGLEPEVQPIEYRNGAESTSFVSKMPGMPKYTNIQLKRGFNQEIPWSELTR